MELQHMSQDEWDRLIEAMMASHKAEKRAERQVMFWWLVTIGLLVTAVLLT